MDAQPESRAQAYRWLQGELVEPTYWSGEVDVPSSIKGVPIQMVVNFRDGRHVKSSHKCGEGHHCIKPKCFKDGHMAWCKILNEHGMPCLERATGLNRMCTTHKDRGCSGDRDKVEELLANGPITLPYVDPIEQAEATEEPGLAEAPVPKITKKERTKLKIQEKKKRRGRISYGVVYRDTSISVVNTEPRIGCAAEALRAPY